MRYRIAAWALLGMVGLLSTVVVAAEQPATAPADEGPLEVVRRQVSDKGVTVATLSNGLTLIVQENHNVPVVTVQCLVRAGGMFEGKWLGCGLSHLVEHLVAKGATRGAGHAEASRESSVRLDAIGAQSNAYTSLARTLYYVSCASGRTAEAIDILCDWMVHPAITRSDFEREHGVVQRELEMGLDDADRQMWYAHMANFYQNHPAAVPVIGYIEPLQGLTYEDVIAYHGKMYVPKRMIFVVVGDVETDDVIESIARACADFPAGRVAPTVLPEVPPLTGVRRVIQPNPSVKDANEKLSFRTIPLVHEDLYALDVLSYVLTNGPSSRLHRILLREKKLVTAISSSSWTPDWGAGQFTFSFRADPDKIDAAEEELLAQLRVVVEKGISDKELDKAKRQKVADYVYSQQDVASQAATLSSDYESTGTVDFSQQYTARIQKVTAKQVQAMAKKYFDFEAMAITRMVPVETAAAVVAEAEGARKQQALRFQLENGLTVVLSPTDTVDLVAMNLAVSGGVLTETADTNGLGTLMTKLSVKGAGGRSADQIAEFFDRAGGSISAMCGNNTFLWSAQTLSADAVKAVEILADVAIKPSYPAGELDILRPQILAAIKQTDEQWSAQMRRNFRQKFFTNSPFGLQPLGSTTVVEKADRKVIAAHHDTWVKAGSAVLTVFGNFDLDAMRTAIEKRFAAMPAGTNTLVTPPARTVEGEGETYVLPTTNRGAAIMIGWPGMKVTDTADRDAMAVLDTIISGYQLPRGWLHEELRGQRLVYVVHAYNWVGQVPGAFVVYAATQPDRAEEVVERIRKNIARTLTHEFTQAEVDEAVNMVITADLLDGQTMSDLSMQAALDELYGLGYDYGKSLEKRLSAVTIEDVKRVADKYLSGAPVVTITTPAAEQEKVD